MYSSYFGGIRSSANNQTQKTPANGAVGLTAGEDSSLSSNGRLTKLDALKDLHI